MNISGIYAFTSQLTNGSLSTGIVDIKIQNYELNSENNEEIFNQNKKCSPGEIISLIPKIENIGESCFVRIKINYIDDTVDFMDFISGFSSNWEKYGDYYYYNKVLNSNENVEIFKTIKIPDSINTNNESIVLTIIAEAVQERNFNPDYSSNNPWGDIVPQKSINNALDINTNKDASKITIKYENNTDQDIKVPNDFLKNISAVMPGNNYIEYVKLNNISKTNSKYYVMFKFDERYTKEKELLSKLGLVIKNKSGKVIYSGRLVDTYKIFLGTYNINESDEFEFDVSVPIELGNEYMALTPNFDVIFSAEYEENQITGTNNNKTDDGIIKTLFLNPKTGDTIDWAILVFFISSICLIITIILGYIENKKERNDINN